MVGMALTSARVLLPLLVVLAAGCSSSDDAPTAEPSSAEPVASTPAAAATSGTPAGAGVVSVVARDYSFAGLESLSPKAGDTVTFRMNNAGERIHDLVISGPDGTRVGGVEAIEGGESAEAAVALKAAGVYSYICTIGQHAALGMKGEFTVG
jgi:plastocyanin